MRHMSPSFDIDRFLGLPRLSDLRCSPDGGRLVVTLAQPVPDGTRLRSALWELDPAGRRPPRRLTRSAQGEGTSAFLPDGSLLFVSPRPRPEPGPEPEPGSRAGLWLLPAAGGEARDVVTAAGGIEALRAARGARTVALVASRFPGTDTAQADAQRAAARTQAGVSAVLFERYPIRHWDHYLGPRERHLLALALPEEEEPIPEPRDLLPDAGASFDALEHVGFDLTPDGATVLATVASLVDITHPAVDLVAFDVAAGTSRRLTPSDARYEDPACSPDGRWVAAVRETLGDPAHASTRRLWLLDLETGQGRDLAPAADLWPAAPAWAPDGSAVFFLSEYQGSGAVFRVEVATGVVTSLVRTGTITDLCPAPDGSTLFALGSTFRVPPRPVRLDARAADQAPAALRSPAADEEATGAPGRVERIVSQANDGVPIGAWLVLPPEASAAHPAPLVTFVHGGPLGSWTDGWHWRWNPQVLVARGYAVLLPDPAFSIGYGQALVDRGWGRWNERPYTDLLTAIDAAERRPEIDPSRTALMGGSFGGYMANWVAGHTDRFRCIVTHASLWDLRGFHGTTDDGNAWELEFGNPYLDPRRYVEQSPSGAIASIRTPMLVIHGELDARVPISEALRLWTDLQRHGVDSKFLYFPDENHWVLKPQNARLWYQTVLAFLDHHVQGKPWERPALL
jgi:dipeptidyl aminopeptidase/acylaminoacyl peptidase